MPLVPRTHGKEGGHSTRVIAMNRAYPASRFFARKLAIVLLLVLLPCFFARAQSGLKILSWPHMSPIPPGTTVYRDLPYVTNGHPRQKLDLYLPQNPDDKNLPLLIWVHGGAFCMGDKGEWIGAQLAYLARGSAVASINYRLSQDAIFPAQIEDCKAAVRWLRANAAQYHLDPIRFAAWGASAGGHLAAMLGTAGNENEFDVGENLDQSSRVQVVVDYFGPTDLSHLRSVSLEAGSVESRLIGCAIRDNPDKAGRASPVTYVTKDAPPFLIVHGDADPIVPYSQSQRLESALENAGVPVIFYTVKGGRHGGFTDPQVPALTRQFLEKYLHPTAP